MPGMGIRDKLVLAFFILIIAPMVLLWARWQETAMGGAKLAMQGVLRDRAREVSEQITRQFDARGKELLELTSRGEGPDRFGLSAGPGCQLQQLVETQPGHQRSRQRSTFIAERDDQVDS